MITKDVLGKLMYNHPNFRSPFTILGILTKDRMISPKDRSELDNLLSVFDTNAKIISVFGQVQLTMIIQPEMKGKRQIPVILIRGIHCTITEMSKTAIIDELKETLNLKDYIPDAFVKKIIYIDSFDNTDTYGMIFSEYTRNKWTMGDPFEVGTKALIKTTGLKLIQGLVDSLALDIRERKENDSI